MKEKDDIEKAVAKVEADAAAGKFSSFREWEDAGRAARQGPPIREWSTYQQAVFAHVESEAEHLLVEAVAGSGKTTTIVEAVQYAPRTRHRRVMCAFNKSIATELQSRSKGAYDAKTHHSLGMGVVRSAFGQFTVSETKDRDLATEVCRENGLAYRTARGDERVKGVSQVARLAAIAKNTLTEETDVPALIDLAIDFDLLDDGIQDAEKLAAMAGEAMRRAAEQTSVISFDDMVWFPARHKLTPRNYDMVVVDETQDLNAAQLYLVQAIARKNAQIVCVGDRRQAIYGFRGADSAAMDRIKAALSAKELPLSITYRCPLSVVRLAQEVVPQIQAAPGAPEGIVEVGLKPEALDTAQPGDLILSRKKAPLLGIALRYAARDVPVAILGKDIGKKLAQQIEDSGATAPQEVIDWALKRAAKIAEKHGEDRPEKVEEAHDVLACFEALAERSSSVSEMISRVNRLFLDDENGGPRARVLCSTVHKAKGLERDSVFMVGDTFKLWKGQRYEQERNLYYVAVTRAKKHLKIVGQVAR